MFNSRDSMRVQTRCLTIVWLLLGAVFFQCPVFSQQPRESEQQILQIQQLIAQGDLIGARQMLSAAVKRFPIDAGLDNLRGIVEAQEGNFAAAESSFQSAVRRAPKFTGAYLNLGRLYQERSLADPQAARKALNVYEQVLRYDANHAEANYQSATLLVRQGAYQAALDHLSRLPAKTQHSAPALSISCAAYIGLGDGQRADEAVARLVAHPDFSELDVQTVQTTLTAVNGAPEWLIKLLKGLQQRQQLSPAMTRLLAAAEARINQSPGEPTKPSVPLLLDLARTAHQQRDYKKSLGYLAHARDLEPQNANLHYYFGLVCVNLDLLAEAYEAFGKAVQLEPNHALYNYARGTIAAFRRDPAEAVPYFEKYLQLKPQDPRAKLALGVALFRAKDYEAAAKMLDDAAVHQENAATAHYYLGSIAKQRKQLAEALREFELALKANPEYTDALAELGQYYLLQKNYAQAEQHIRRALTINPDHYAANLNLLTLYTRTKNKNLAEQEKRFAEVQQLRETKAQEFLRIVEVHPFPVP